jgi:outer membrane biosynthesis protein TonB
MNLSTQQYRAIAGTIIVHILLIGLFFITGLSTPLPLPTEQSLIINFGNVDQGSGLIQNDNFIQSQKTTEPVKNTDKEEYMTQNNEEAASLPEKKKKTEEKKVTDNKDFEKEKLLKEESEKKKLEEQKQNINDLAKNAFGKTNQENSQGTSGDNGIQGSKDGIPNGSNLPGNAFSGNISYSLQGRNPQSLPKPDYNIQVEGIVVVEVTVNTQGIVTDAVAGVKGSTTLNPYLLKQAKEAALKARFDQKSDAPAYQKGTITYYFKLY